MIHPYVGAWKLVNPEPSQYRKQSIGWSQIKKNFGLELEVTVYHVDH
jgi:hypothetical protein